MIIKKKMSISFNLLIIINSIYSIWYWKWLENIDIQCSVNRIATLDALSRIHRTHVRNIVALYFAAQSNSVNPPPAKLQTTGNFQPSEALHRSSSRRRVNLRKRM